MRLRRWLHEPRLLQLLVLGLTAACVALGSLWVTDADFGDPRWGTWGEWTAGVGAVVLLAFEIGRVFVVERRAEVATARRVHSWLEPNQWIIDRQGVIMSHDAGWLLVVANDTDDVVVEWMAKVIDAGGVAIAEAGSARRNGSLPPRRPLRFVLPKTGHSGASPGDPPEHYTLVASIELRYRDHQGQVWAAAGDGSVVRCRSSDPLEASDGVAQADRLGPRGVERQGIARWQQQPD